MRQKTNPLLVAASFLMVAVMARADDWAARPSGLKPVGFQTWTVYWDEPGSTADGIRYSDSLEEIAVFAYHFNPKGQLIPANPHVIETITQLKASKPNTRILITLVNDVVGGRTNRLKDPEIVHEAVGSALSRVSHTRAILKLAKDADGVEVDYEKVAYADRDDFATWLEGLAADLHDRGQRLSVVVQPRTESMSATALRKSGAATIDWARTAKIADQIKVMAYLYSYEGSEPGSVAPISWVREIAVTALKTIPADKAVIVLHLGGFDWPRKQRGHEIEYSGIPVSTEVVRPLALDNFTASGYMQYRDMDNVLHDVWVETAEGIKAKIDALRGAGVLHIGLWRLGSGDPNIWSALSEFTPPKPKSASLSDSTPAKPPSK